MFKHDGPSRGFRRNAILAAYLATVAGFANSGGFILSGHFTSHVTGNVAQISTDLALGGDGAREAFWFVIAFLGGAFAATVVIESPLFSRRPHAYGTALLLEALLLGGFFACARGRSALDAGMISILCAAMGLQNSLVTRLSSAVVRTTHLTGVITDLGIELGRWARWLLRRGRDDGRPSAGAALLYGVIASAFAAGAMAGAFSVVAFGPRAILVPAAMIAAASVYAFVVDGSVSAQAA